MSTFFRNMVAFRFARVFPGVLLSIYGLFSLTYLTTISWSKPVLDMFGFRQAQTALSIYWLVKGGPDIAYETPTAGYPWSIPFEFPFYQWVVALFAQVNGFSIDQSGRVISIVFFLGAAVALYKIIVKLSSDRALALICVGVFFSSPLAIFWARSVMIESSALFFSLMFLYGVTEYFLTGKKRFVFFSIFFAIAGALIKITTFYCFAIILVPPLLIMLAKDIRVPGFGRVARTSLLAGLSVGMSLVLLVIWVRYSDYLKSQTVFGSSLTSSAISGFNFGTLKQRLDIHSWLSITFGRAVYQILGSFCIFLVSAAVLVFNKKFRWIGLLLLFGYLIPFMTFTNLYYVHSYYQFANFTFLTTMTGLAIGSVNNKGKIGMVIASFAAVGMAVASWETLDTYFIPTITANQSHSRIIDLARFIRANTVEDQALLIFGLDWSSELPYYATRKAVVFPDWGAIDNLKQLLDPRKSFGAERLGALVVCPNTLGINDASELTTYRAIINKYSYGRRTETVAGCQISY